MTPSLNPSPAIAKIAPNLSKASPSNFSQNAPSGGLSDGWTASRPNETDHLCLTDERGILHPLREHIVGSEGVDVRAGSPAEAEEANYSLYRLQ